MLIPLVKSQIHPYANLWNNIILNEQFNHLKFKELYKEIFSDKEERYRLLIEFLVLFYMINMNFIHHPKNMF